MSPSSILADVLGEIVPTSEDIGVRVEIVVVNERGGQNTVSVTINAPPDATLEAVMQAAIDYVESGQLSRLGDDTGSLSAGAAGILSVIRGGLESPAITMGR